MRRLFGTQLLLVAVSGVLSAAPVLAQTTPAGVVTAVHGTAMIARAASKETSPLQFKDGVFLYDRITTGERSLARILLGGKAVVTARERSTVTITAVPGTATVELEHGRLLLAVDKGAMRAGESIDVKTRNAIMGIRGTVIIADVVPGKALDGSADATTFTILSGVVEVTQLDPRSAHGVGGPLRLGALQSVRVTGTTPPELTAISREQAKRMSEGFGMPIRPQDASKEVVDRHAERTKQELERSTISLTSSEESTSGSPRSNGKDKDSKKVPAVALTAPGSAVTSDSTGKNGRGTAQPTATAPSPGLHLNNGVAAGHLKKAGLLPK